MSSHDVKPRPGSVFTFDPPEFPVVNDGITDARELWPFQRAFLCQLIVTGATAPLSGSFDVQGSVDNVNFFSLTDSTMLPFAGNGTYAINFANTAPRFVRAYVTASIGACTGSVLCSVV